MDGVPPNSPGSSSKGLAQVLLIDDNPAQLRVRELVLRSAGVEVSVATTADSALALLRSDAGKQVALVITDHIMPGASGAEFVRELRSAGVQIPVIVVSGAAEAAEEYQGMDVTFRMKPCAPEELIALVKQRLAA